MIYESLAPSQVITYPPYVAHALMWLSLTNIFLSGKLSHV